MAEFFLNDGGNLDGNKIMRQYLQISTSATIVGLDEMIGLVSDMGGGNDRLYTLLRNDGKKMNDDEIWPADFVTSMSPANPSVEVHIWSCSTHGEKNIGLQLHKSRSDGSGTKQFVSSKGINFGWWNIEACLEDETERYKKGGTFRSDLTTIQAVKLDSYSTMNACSAKAPFTEKTIAAMMDKCAKYLGLPVKMELTGEVNPQSREQLQRKLDALKEEAVTKESSGINSNLAVIDFCIAASTVNES